MKKQLEKVKDITSDRLVQAGIFRLSHDVCQHQIEREQLRAEADKEAVTNRHTKKKLRKAKAYKIREKNILKADSKDLHFMVRYFSSRTDKKLPNLQKATMRVRYTQTRHRGSSDITPCTSDVEDDCRETKEVYHESSNFKHGSTNSNTADDANNDDNHEPEIVQALQASTAHVPTLGIAALVGAAAALQVSDSVSL